MIYRTPAEKELARAIYRAIKHGSHEHRNWLRAKSREVAAGYLRCSLHVEVTHDLRKRRK